jgi:hypothetical protein
VVCSKQVSPKSRKTNIIKSVMSNSPHCALTIGYKDKDIEETVNSKFLGLHLDNLLEGSY